MEAERAEGLAVPAPKSLLPPSEAFVALPVAAKSADSTPIRIEVRRGAVRVRVQWPSIGDA